LRARLRRKLAKKLAHERLKQLIHYIISKADICEPTEADCLLKIRLILFRAAFGHYRHYGKPMLPIGFAWIKAPDGPELVWKGER
jgi:hypothetical protein